MSSDRRVVLRVRVTPRARGDALVVDADGMLRVRLTAPPVDGAANRALLELLADRLELRRGDLEVARGSKGRDKLVAVRGCSEADLARRLARAGAPDVDKRGRRG